MDPEVPQLKDISTYIGNILVAAIPLIGMVSFIMVLVGGFTILTSSGNPEAAQKGKSTITYAVGGVILAIAAWLTLQLIEELTGAKVTEFDLSF